jgi:hypothetical protein
MTIKFSAELRIGRVFVCHQVRFAARDFDCGCAQCLCGCVFDMKRSGFGAAFDQRHDDVFFWFWLIGAVLGLAANIGFVGFYHFVGAADAASPFVDVAFIAS